MIYFTLFLLQILIDNIFIIIKIFNLKYLMQHWNLNKGNDSLFLAITLHICGQMELLKTEFINYGIKSKNINEDFSMLILRHRYLIEHAELLADVISIVLLVQVLFSCLIISLIGKYLLNSILLQLCDACIIQKMF